MFIMLISTCFHFLICSLPLSMNKIFSPDEKINNLSAIKAVCYKLAYSHYSLNFIFYFLFADKYRKAFELRFEKFICKREQNIQRNMELIELPQRNVNLNEMKRSIAISSQLNNLNENLKFEMNKNKINMESSQSNDIM